jgi:hypothetical protein
MLTRPGRRFNRKVKTLTVICLTVKGTLYTSQMSASVSLRNVLRPTFGIYAQQAPVLLIAAIVVDGVVALDRMRFDTSPALAIGEALVDLVVIGLFVCVVVGALRTFGRSRELVRGNARRVLALILMLAFPLALAVSEIERATRTVGSAPATAARLLIAALIAPIPILAATALYFELRRVEPVLTAADPTPTGVLPSGVSLP